MPKPKHLIGTPLGRAITKNLPTCNQPAEPFDGDAGGLAGEIPAAQPKENIDLMALLMRIKTRHDVALYSAAPDLLSALIDLMEQLEGIGIAGSDDDADEGQWRGTEGLTFAKARAAIAKTKL
jgi:hypothetical protein